VSAGRRCFGWSRKRDEAPDKRLYDALIVSPALIVVRQLIIGDVTWLCPVEGGALFVFVRFSDNRWLAVFVRFVIVVLLAFFIVVIIGVSRRHQGADHAHPSENALRDE